MITQILTRRRIRARDVSSAMKIVKKKYPFAKLVMYKFDEDFRITKDKNYKNRTITVAFIPNIKTILLG